MNALRTLPVFLGLLALTAGGLLLSSAGAEAHERREVGQYTFVVGFLSEPALLNQPNGVDLRVSRTSDASPVEGLEQTLRVEVRHGEKSLNVDLRPRFRAPGAYDGRFFPTAEGVYVFHFTGTIEGFQVNEVFTSGPGTFNSVEAPLAFPQSLPSVQQLEERLLSLENGGNPSTDSGSATAIAVIALVVGGAGLVLGGLSLARRSGR